MDWSLPFAHLVLPYKTDGQHQRYACGRRPLEAERWQHGNAQVPAQQPRAFSRPQPERGRLACGLAHGHVREQALPLLARVAAGAVQMPSLHMLLLARGGHVEPGVPKRAALHEDTAARGGAAKILGRESSCAPADELMQARLVESAISLSVRAPSGRPICWRIASMVRNCSGRR